VEFEHLASLIVFRLPFLGFGPIQRRVLNEDFTLTQLAGALAILAYGERHALNLVVRGSDH
jgi:hypothetical protein